jgi:NAD(P)-dependent dehydrogenase (short-subunit alcohol dehydrogenase family)
VRALANVLVTGATGFIGSHVARLIAERGDELRLGVEPDSADPAIADLDAERIRLELRERRSVPRALGWRTRPHEETLGATVSWQLEREHARIARSRCSRPVRWRFAGLAIGAAQEARRLTSMRP